MKINTAKNSMTLFLVMCMKFRNSDLLYLLSRICLNHSSPIVYVILFIILVEVKHLKNIVAFFTYLLNSTFF